MILILLTLCFLVLAYYGLVILFCGALWIRGQLERFRTSVDGEYVSRIFNTVKRIIYALLSLPIG